MKLKKSERRRPRKPLERIRVGQRIWYEPERISERDLRGWHTVTHVVRSTWPGRTRLALMVYTEESRAWNDGSDYPLTRVFNIFPGPDPHEGVL